MAGHDVQHDNNSGDWTAKQHGSETLSEVLDAGYVDLGDDFNSETANAERQAARQRYTRRTGAL